LVGTGADAVCWHGIAAWPNAGEEEQAALVPRLEARKRVFFICGYLIVAALDVDYHEGTFILPS
jgi:hypothetical protein